MEKLSLHEKAQQAFSKANEKFRKTFESVKHRPKALIAGAILAGVLVTFATFALPAAVWVALPSLNCPVQGNGNVMVSVGNYVYVLGTPSGNSFWRLEPTSGSCNATALADPPSFYPLYGASMEKIDSDTIYAYMGGSSSDLFMYKITQNKWYSGPNSRSADTSNADLIPMSYTDQGFGTKVYGLNNEVYYFSGNETKKYRPATNDWVTIATRSITSGASFTSIGNTIYSLTPNQMYSFDSNQTLPGSWTSEDFFSGTSISGGAGITAVGNQIYAIIGSNTNTFYRYDTTAAAGSKWKTTTTDGVTALAQAPDFIYGGGAIIYPGTGDYLYIIQGNHQKRFWRYSLSTNTWSSLADTPDPVAAGGSLTTDGTHIYATPGNGSREIWRYSITNNRWNNELDGTIIESAYYDIGSNFFADLTNNPQKSGGGITYIASGTSGGGELFYTTGNRSTNLWSGEIFRVPLTGTNAFKQPMWSLPKGPVSNYSEGATPVYPGPSAEDPTGSNMYLISGSSTALFTKFLIPYNTFIPWNRAKITFNGDPNYPLSQSLPLQSTTLFPSSGTTILEVNGKIYYLFGNSFKFYRFDPARNEWKKLTDSPTQIGAGAAMVKIDNNTIYAFAGANSLWLGENRGDVLRYDIPSDTWMDYSVGKLSDGRIINQNFGTQIQNKGNSMEMVNGKLYVIWGSTGAFYRFDTDTNTWQFLSNSTSVAPGQGSSMEAIGTDIYFMNTLSGSATLYKYDTLTNVITTRASMGSGTPTESWAGSGNSLIYPGSGDYLYAFKGYYTGNNRVNRQFWRYSISGNTWTQMANTPQDVDGGASLAALSSDPTNIYALAGGRSKKFWRYNVTSNTWSSTKPDGITALPETPDEVMTGSDLETDGTYLYATQGGDSYNFWRYSFTTNTWTSLTNTPAEVGYTCGLNSGGNCVQDTADLVFNDPTPGSPSSGDEEIWLTTGWGVFGPKTGSSCSYSSGVRTCGVLFRYRIASNDWPIFEKPEPAPYQISSGAALSYPGTGNFIYAFKGNSSRDFWMFDFINNRWHAMYEPILDSGVEIAKPTDQTYTSAPGTTANVDQGQGNEIVEVNGKIYMIMGNGAVGGHLYLFMRYDPIANAWTRLPDTPFSPSTTAMVKYDNNTIYLRQHGMGGLAMGKYIIDADPTKAGDQGVWSVFNLGIRDDGVPLNQGDNLRPRSIVQSGTKFYVLSDDSTAPFRSFDPTTNEWTSLQWTPVSLSSSSDLVAVGSDEIYAVLGGTGFYKYTISTNHWTTLTSSSGSCSSAGLGSSLTYHASGNYIYRVAGGNTTGFCRFNVATQTWDGTARAAAPATVYGGSSSTIIGNNIYVTRGNGANAFWRYNITNDRWNNALDGEDPTNGGSTTLNDAMPSTIYGGSGLASDGTYIYATHGNKSTAFWRYNPSAAVGSRWSAITPAPVRFNQTQGTTFSDGGEITLYDPTAGSPGDEEIWAVGANSYDGFGPATTNDVNVGGALFRYKISTNTWPYMPGPQYIDTSSIGGSNSLTYSRAADYTADDTTDTLTDANHGLANGSKITLTTTGSFPTGLSTGPYYVVNMTTNTFQLASTVGGSPIDFTSTGTGTQTYVPAYMYGFITQSQFGKYDLVSNQWTYYNRPKYLSSTSTDPIEEYGVAQGLGNSVVSVNNKIYMAPGGSSDKFFSYDPATNRWTELDNLPGSSATFGTGATLMAFDSDTIYALSNSTANFYKYSISKNGWTPLANTPASGGHGQALAYPGSGDYIFSLRGGGTTTMYKYCFQNTGSGCTVGTWGTLTAVTPATMGSGSTMIGLGGALYALRGNLTNSFYKYTITTPSTGEGTWSSMALMQTPSQTYTPDFVTDTFTAASHGMYNGTKIRIATTGTVPGGLGTATDYYIINVTTNTFQISTTLGGTAFNFSSNGTGTQSFSTSYTGYAGTNLTTDGTDLYATVGNATNAIMKYTVASNTWSMMPTLPTTVQVGDNAGNTKGGLTYIPSGPSGGPELYVCTGNDNYQVGSNTHAMIYGMPFTGPNAMTWPMITAPADMPASIGMGSSVLHPGSGQLIYALQGGSTNFWSFNIGTEAWNAFDPADRAGAVGGGANLVTNEIDTIYTARGGATNEIYAYCYTTGPNCPSANVWSSLTNFRTTVGTTNDRGGIAYMSTGPSGGPELFLSTGNGQTYTVQSDSVTTPGRRLLFRYPFTGPNAGTWPINNRTPLAIPDSAVAAGGSLVYSNGAFDGANGSLYAFLGNATNAFRKFTITNSPNPGDGTWSTPTTSGFSGTVSTGGSLVSDGSGTTLYAMNGGATTTTQKYTITGASTGTWTTLTAAPVTYGQNISGEMIYYNGKLWMNTGNAVNDMLDTYGSNYTGLLYIYDITSNTWPFYYQAADLPASSNTFGRGSDATSTPNGLSIYALRSDPSFNVPSAGNPNFWKYTISGSGVGTWASQQNLLTNSNVISPNSGAAIAAVNDNIIYALRGGNTSEFYRFDATAPAGSQWTAQSSLPVGVGNTSSSAETGDLVWNSIYGYLYATPGNDTTTSPYTIYSYPVNRLVITSITKTGGGTPIAGQSMDVTVQAVDYNNNPITVSNNVQVTLSLYTGSGSIGGVVTGTINSGNSSTTITGTTYSIPEGGIVFSAADTTSPANPTTFATSNSDPFTVNGAPPDITSLSVTSGSTAGKTAVTINGTNFYTNYKRTIGITNPGSTLTNYPVRFTLNTQSLISAGKMRSDCGDIRFTAAGAGTYDYGNLTQLSYWIESGCNSTNTAIWVKVPTLTASATTNIDLFYGDSRLTSATNGGNTFIFFDDFAGTTLTTSKWTEVDAGSNVTVNERLVLTSGGSNQGIYSIADGTDGNNDGNSDFDRANNLVLEYDFYPTSTSSTLLSGWKDTTNTLGGTSTAVGSGGFIHGITYNGTSTGSTNDIYESTTSSNSTNAQRWFSTRNYKVRVILRNAASGNGAIYQRSWDSGKTWVTWATTTARTDATARIAFSNSFTAGEIDNVKVYTYAGSTLTTTTSDETPNLAVQFGGSNAIINSISTTQINVETPSNTVGAKNVDVTIGDGQSTIETNAYTYQLPTITLVAPDTGLPAGGSTITITGADFAPNSYRKPITINNLSGGALTDYQVAVTLDTATLISAGKMHGLGNDIRFYDSDGTTLINNYWIEGPMNSASTKIWVKVPSISAASNKTIYIEYGDLSLSALSSINNTFIREIDSLSLAASYPMDESSGNISDYSGNGNTGTQTNTTVAAGKFNNGRNFNGTSSLIDAGNNAATSLISGLTLESWVKLTTTLNGASPRLISKSDNTSSTPSGFASGYDLEIGDPNNGSASICGRAGNIANKVVFSLGDSSGTVYCVAPTTAISPVTGTWHHIVATFDPATITGTVYVDGVQAGINTALVTEAINTNSNFLTLGRASNTSFHYLSGMLDDVRIYSRPLTAAEVSDLYGTAPNNNQGYTTTQYPGRVLVRKFQTPEPSATLGSESPNISVTFDGISATVSSASSTSIVVTNPAHSIATVPVVITNADGQTATGSFTYAVLTPDKTNTTVIASPTSGLEADGVDSSTVTVTLLTDAAIPAPVPNHVVTLAQLTGTVGGTTITAINCPSEPAGPAPGTSNINGKACFTVKTPAPGANNYEDTYTFEATDTTDSIVFDDIADHPSITFDPPVTHKTNSTVTAPAGNVIADNVSTKTITVTLKNDNNVNITNRTVTLNQTSGPGTTTITPASGDTNSSGVRTFTVGATVAGTYVFQATDTEATPNVTLDDTGDTITVIFIAGPTDPNVLHSTLVSDIYTIPANGSNATLTATIKDQYDNPRIDYTVQMSRTSGPAAETITAIDCVSPEPPGTIAGKSNTNGKACATVSATQSGTYVIQAVETDSAPDVTLDQTVTLNFTGPTANDSTLTITPSTTWADGSSYLVVKATIKDASNNTFPNQLIELNQITGTGITVIDAINCTTEISTGSGTSTTTNSSGEACFAVTSVNRGTYTFQANNNTESQTITQTVNGTFTEGELWQADGKELAYAIQDNSIYPQRHRPKVVRTSDNNFVAISGVITPSPDYDGTIYIQKFDSNGTNLWPSASPNDTGIQLDISTTGSDLQNGQYELLADNSGGVFVLWEKSSVIYGQRLDSNGNYLWGATPKTIVSNARSANFYDCGGSSVDGVCSTIPLISDGAGGFFITYWDLGVTVGGRFRVSRYDSNGDMITGEGWPQPVVGGADQTSANVCVTSPVNLTLIRPGAVRVGYVRQVPDHTNNVLCNGFVGDRYGERYRSINTSNPADFIYDGTLDTRSNYTVDPDLTTSYGSCSFVTPGSVDWIQQIEDGSGGVYALVINNCPLLNTQNGRLIVHYRNKDGVLWNYELSPGGTSSYRTNFEAISDGAGGIIVLYNTEEGNDKLFLTRIRNSASNQPEEVWNGGTRIQVANTYPYYYHVVSGGTAGSAIVVYSINVGFDDYYYVKKYDSDGNFVAGWPTTGVEIGPEFFEEPFSNVSDNQGKSVVADGSGGIIVTGENFVTGWINVDFLQQFPNMIQRVNSSGSIMWNAGEPLDINPGLDIIDRPLKEQAGQKVIYLDNGEYIALWEEEARSWFDQRQATHNIHADKFDSLGNHIWQTQINERLGAGFAIGEDPIANTTDNDSIDIAQDINVDNTVVGSLVTWRNLTSTGTNYIVAEKVDTDGVNQWGNIYDTSMSGATVAQPDIISDNNSGAYLTWIKNNDVYVRKINSAGAFSWTTQVTNTSGIAKSNPRLVKYGSTSLYVIYEETNGGTGKDVKVQKLNPSNGALGISTYIDNNIGNQEIGDLIPIGSAVDGFIIAYTDDQAGVNNKKVVAKKFNSSLTENTFAGDVTGTTENNQNPKLASDNEQGAYIVWEKYNAANTASNIAFTRLKNNYAFPYLDTWTLGAPGVDVLRQNPQIVSDGLDTPYNKSGFFVTWQQANGAVSNIYTAHVINNIPQEGAAGVQISDVGTRTDVNPQIATDLQNRVFHTWEGSSSPSDIIGQSTFEADNAYSSTFVTDNATVIADGSTTAILTATLLDQSLTPVVGRTIRIDQIYSNDQVNGDPIVTPYTDATHCPGGTPGVTDSNGQACFTVTHNIGGVQVRFAATDITDTNNYLTISDVVDQNFSYVTPVLDTLTPDTGNQDGGETIHVTGSGFYPDTQFYLDGNPVTSTFIDYNNAEFTTPAHAAGTVDVNAVNDLILSSNNLPFEYLISPIVTSITPSESLQNTTPSVTIVGLNFDPSATVKLTMTGEPDIDCTSPTVSIDGTTITCNLDLTGVAIGSWNVVVTNPGNLTGTLPNGFQVELPVDAGLSTVVANPISVPADGGATIYSIITVTLRDQNNNPVDNDTVRLTSIAGSGSPGIDAVDCDTEIFLLNVPANEAVTGIDGRACFAISHNNRGTHTFQAEDTTLSVIITQTADVEFTCVVGPNEQCAELTINGGTGALTVTAPSDFIFPAAAGLEQSFSQNDPGYVLNVNDVVTVSDTRTAGGFNLQVQADVSGFTDGLGHYLPLQNLFVATKASSTGGTQNNGVEYSGPLTSPQNIVAYQDTTGSLIAPGSFTACGISLGTGSTLLSAGTPTPIDLMLAGLSVGGRNGEFKQNVNYFLDVPIGAYTGSYSITLTYTVTDDTSDPPATPPSCP